MTHKDNYEEEVAKLLKRLDDGEKLTDEEVNKVKYFQDKEEKKVLDKIVKGVNDIFIKEYKFADMGGLTFTIKIKAPNMLEQGRINEVRERLLGGTSTMQTNFNYVVYNTLALLEVCGIDVPKELDPSDLYNPHIPYQIGEDFAEWLDRFQY